MRLEDQVASVELCKRLKELGVKQDSLFTWVSYPGREWPNGRCVLASSLTINPKDNGGMVRYSAFTITEMAEILNGGNVSMRIRSRKKPKYAVVETYTTRTKKSDSLPESLAEMLIHLIERGLVKTEKA